MNSPCPITANEHQVMPDREIARHLGITHQAVYEARKRAEQKLRAAILQDPVLRQHLRDERLCHEQD